MRSHRSVLILVLFVFLLGAKNLLAQTGNHFVTGATLYLSTGDWSVIYLNGQQLVDQYPYTSVTKGYVTLRLERDQLCFFKKQNVLAVEYSQTLNFSSGLGRDDTLGVAYLLELTFSDGQKTIFSSNDDANQSVFEITDKSSSNPAGWKEIGYDDASWAKAELKGPNANIEKVLKDPKTNKVIQYLFCMNAEGMVAHLGERRLFRRRFDLDIVPAPPCPQNEPPPTETPRPKPTATITFTHTPVPPPRPTVTPSFTRTPRPQPTETPTPRPIIRRPTATPVPVRKHRVIPTWTPTRVVVPVAPTPIKRRAWPTDTPTPRPIIPTPTFTEAIVGEALPQTIVFVSPPVNILVTFKDGAGKYKVEVVDSRERHIQTLYEKRVSFERETWLSWDGKNEEGQLQAYGHYSAVFSKDGKVLRHIALEWIPPDN